MMRATSALYDNLVYADERKTNMRASFRLVDIDAADDASAYATDEADVSQIEQTHDRVEMAAKFATLEPDQWRLDGSFDILADDLSDVQTGWWSDALSGADGAFDVPPELHFEFTTEHSSAGLTIIFDEASDNYATEFTVVVYDAADNIIDSVLVTNDSSICSVEMPIEDYRYIAIVFNRTNNPYRRVRATEVVFGLIELFTADNTTGMTISYELSPVAEALPAAELTLVIDNSNRRYNMINPDGVYRFLQQAQPIDIELGFGNGEYISMGRFYFAQARASDSSMTAEITAYNRAYQMEMPYRHTVSNTTLEALVSDILSDLDIEVSMPSELAEREVRYVDDATRREALRMAAQAAKCTCYFDRDNVLVFKELAEGEVVNTLDHDNMYEPVSIEVAEYINVVQIRIGDTDYTAADIKPGETAQVKLYDNKAVRATTVQDVVGWLLVTEQSTRVRFVAQERGNPAVELGDTIKLIDRYGENRNGIVTRQEFFYDGTLSAVTEGVLV